ncbi:MAG: hypothetical protein GX548_12510, partial [Lentisphaerae bacterium]|nr:hypothetical protein [Lentisphaerota bacterium]
LDRSEIRRGAPALFRRMDALLDGECGGFRGTDLALVSGDLLYTLAMDSLLRTQAPPERLAAAMEEFMRAALDTGRGALMEIRAAQLPMEDLDVQAVESMYAAKTGSYSFALPVRMAFGLCEGEGLFPFDRFGKHAGIAYQLKNDCDGLGQWLNGGRVPDDLRDRRRIWGVVHAWQAADEDGRALLAAEPGDSLREVFRRAGTVEAMGEAIRHHAGLALECVKDPAMKSFAASVLA